MKQQIMAMVIVLGIITIGNAADNFPVVPIGGFVLSSQMKDSSTNPNGDRWLIFEPSTLQGSNGATRRSTYRSYKNTTTSRQKTYKKDFIHNLIKELKKEIKATDKKIRTAEKGTVHNGRDNDANISYRVRSRAKVRRLQKQRIIIQEHINDLELLEAGANSVNVLSNRRGQRKRRVREETEKIDFNDAIDPQGAGAINPKTGEYYPRSGKGAINPKTGEYYPRTGYGFINPKTGEYYPSN